MNDARHMLAMRAEPGTGRVRMEQIPIPEAGTGQVRVRVQACGVCRTDLHVVDGDLPDARPGVIPGHEIVGIVDQTGSGVAGVAIGDRVGVAWLGWACGRCDFCADGRENLCDAARFTGYQLDGGYAQYAVADARFVFSLPARYDDVAAAPLLCAGLVGHRAYRMAGVGRRLGIYGFGAAAHIVTQVAVSERRHVFAFTRPGDRQAQDFARTLGAVWAGASDAAPPETLAAALIFASHGPLIPEALSRIQRGGIVVCAGIHMTDIPQFPYRLLWGERTVRSVANLTRADASDFLGIAGHTHIETHVTRYPLTDANRALSDLRDGRLTGAAVLVP